MKRILITTTALAALGLAFIASTNGETVTERIDNAVHDLEKAHAPIPHEALHARALEILRGRTVAADEVKADADAYAKAEACVAFEKAPMHRVNCNK